MTVVNKHSKKAILLSLCYTLIILVEESILENCIKFYDKGPLLKGSLKAPWIHWFVVELEGGMQYGVKSFFFKKSFSS